MTTGKDKKRTILVTGCSDGSLGSALALALHDQGWRVIASARNVAKLSDCRARGVECVAMDVVSEESVSTAVRAVEALTGGSLDGLVNNAGTGYSSPVVHLEDGRLHDLFELNVFSIARVTRLFLPLLLRSAKDSNSSNQQPIIANNTSGSGLPGCGTPFQGAYAASKAAACSLTESMRVELAPFGLRVVNLVTGAVTSTFWDNAAAPRLPEGSIYAVAKQEIEERMAGGGGTREGIMDHRTWASLVAGDLSRRKGPPPMVYRGSMAGLARFVTHLPTGAADSSFKKMAAVDVLENKLKS